MKDYFPLYISLKDKNILVVGGGKIAERKIGILLKCAGKIKIISPTVTKKLKNLIERGLIDWQQKEFEKTDLDRKVFLVVAATNKRDVNEHIAKVCHEKNILINSVTEREEVIFPAIAEEGNISIAISTSGTSPYIAKLLKKDIKNVIKPYQKLLSIIKPLRVTLLTESKDSSYNKKILRKIFSLPLFKWLSEGKIGLVKKEIKKILKENSRSAENI